ncbi:MAG: hypothetical protein U5O39_19060 [Gammaproteobacteria bacterium]|nr:hypothetical protein [Gammaproteobacteria bacterium]
MRGQDISLGADGNGNTIRFGDVTLTGGSIDIAESDAAVLGEVDATDLTYSAGGSITGNEIFEASTANLTADTGTNDIVLDNTGNTIGTLSLLARNALVVNTTGVALASVDVDELTLTSGGEVSDDDTGPG